MDFGLFMMPLHPPRRSVADAYDRDIELLVQADRLGYHEVWIGEHITEMWETTPVPELLIAKALALTERIIFATGITKKRREAPSFTAGVDRCWARGARCPSDQSNPGASRALNGRGEHGGGGPVLQGVVTRR